MMRNVFLIAAMSVAGWGAAAAQESYPVAIGIGGGIQGEINDYYHGMALVTVTPPRSPISLRLDGVTGRRGIHRPTALSASAVITLRPWRVAPYLIVGSSRSTTPAFSYRDPSGAMIWRPSVTTTELTGGLGLKFRLRHKTIFTEMRSLGAVGTPITVGFTF